MSKDNNKEEKKKIIKVLTALTPEEEISRKRFNINPDKPISLDQVGNDFNITGKKIRHIDKKVLKKLKDDLPDDVA